MSGGGTTTNQIQNKDPWGPSVPYLGDIMQQSNALYHSGAGSKLWEGPLQAPLAQQTNMGIQSLTNNAQSQAQAAGQPLAYGQNQIQNNGLTSAYNDPLGNYTNVLHTAEQPTASSTYLQGMASGQNAGKNPYLTQMLDDNASRIANRVGSQMSGAGRLGSFGYGDAMARTITAANAPILSDAYNQDQNRMLSASSQIDQGNVANNATRLAVAGGQTGLLNAGQQNAANWAGMIPQLSASANAPGMTMMGIGDYLNNYNQTDIDKQRQLFEQQQQMPWTQLNRYLGGVSGLGGIISNAGTTTGNSTTSKQLGIQDIFGGGGSSTAAGIGNAGSALLGLLSDRNEKTDIKKIGEDETTGLPLYAYRYKDDPKTYPKIVGPMAQDVEKKYPGSTDTVGGKLYIKSEALGILGLLKKEAA